MQVRRVILMVVILMVTHICSGTCQPLVLARRDAIRHWREVMGPTKVTITTRQNG